MANLASFYLRTIDHNSDGAESGRAKKVHPLCVNPCLHVSMVKKRTPKPTLALCKIQSRACAKFDQGRVQNSIPGVLPDAPTSH